MSLDENGVADSCVDYDRNDEENARGLPGGGMGGFGIDWYITTATNQLLVSSSGQSP